MFLISSCSCPCPIHWSQVFSREWICSWSSADRRCSNYIWVINHLIVYKGVTYIRGLMVIFSRIFIMIWPITTRTWCYIWLENNSLLSMELIYHENACSSTYLKVFISLLPKFCIFRNRHDLEKGCQNPLAQQAVLLALGLQTMGFTDVWNDGLI